MSPLVNQRSAQSAALPAALGSSRRQARFRHAGRLEAVGLGLLLLGCQAEDVNHAPVADAGPDQLSAVRRTVDPLGAVVDTFEEVTLDGSASTDPDGDYLTRFFWNIDSVPVGSQIDLSSFSINRDDSPLTQFTPDQEGIYGFTLEVFDGQRVSLLDYVQVEVLRANAEPVAEAGNDLNGVVAQTLTFDGTGSLDPDGDYLSYQWSLVVVPPGSGLTVTSLVYPATPNPRLTPDVEGVYALALTVSDGLTTSLPDFVTLTVSSGNQSPVIVATPSTVVTPCYDNPVTLDASASFDPEKDPFTFAWKVLETPYGSLVKDGSLSTPDQARTSVKLDLYGLYVFGLTLDDGHSNPATESIALLFDNGSTEVPPEADTGGNRSVQGTVTCTPSGCPPCALKLPLDGTESQDANGDPLTYFWEVIAGDGTLSEPYAAITELTGPALQPPASGRILTASVTVQLTVSDCRFDSEPMASTVYFSCEGL